MELQTESNPNQYSDPIVLVCAADNNYAMPLAVMLRSLLENLENECNLSLFVIDGGIEENNKHKIEMSIHSNKVVLTWLQPFNNLLVENDELQHYYTKAIYYRLCIPELLPQYKKAIYLDSDLIVLSSIKKLWAVDIEDHFILAAQDLYSSPHLSSGYSNYLQSTNTKIVKMFNSGVMVLNLEKWRAESVPFKTIEYISRYKLLDQEALNIVLQNKWKEIDPKWNQTAGIYEYRSWENSPFSQDEFDSLIDSPNVIHFTSANKPWNSIDGHPAQHLFYKYLDMTAWSGWRFTQWKRIQGKVSREVKKFKKRFQPTI